MVVRHPAEHSRMRLITTAEARLELARALRLMTEALDILDALHAPGAIGSTLDLAISRLEGHLNEDEQAATGVRTLLAQLEREFAAAPAIGEVQPSPWDIPPA